MSMSMRYGVIIDVPQSDHATAWAARPKRETDRLGCCAQPRIQWYAARASHTPQQRLLQRSASLFVVAR